MMELKVGIKGEQREIVTADKTAKAMGSGELNVYATPAMIALMEKAAYRSVAEYLDEGQGTVGTMMNIKHVASTPVGLHVRAEAELIAVDRRKLTFHVAAYDEAELIGEGEHERFIIDDLKFQTKADSKLLTR